MIVIGGLIKHEVDLTMAVEALDKAGFRTLTVFGPDELFKEPVVGPDAAETTQETGHTAAGTVGGISVNARPFAPAAGAQPIEDELTQLGLDEDQIEPMMAGLQQGLLLLLVRTKPGRAETAQQILSQYAVDSSDVVTGI